MSPQSCQKIFHKLLEFSVAPQFSQAMEIAGELFALSTGQINDDDFFYEMRAGIFQEFFLFDYRHTLPEYSGLTLLEIFLLEKNKKWSLPAIAEFEQFRSNRRSLFKVLKKISNNIILVEDLFSQQETLVHSFENYNFEAFQNSLIFEGRLFFYEEKGYFSGHFIFHPQDVWKIIENKVKVFLKHLGNNAPQKRITWIQELKRRKQVLQNFEKRRVKREQGQEKAVDKLRFSGKMVQSSPVIQHPALIMWLDSKELENCENIMLEANFYDHTALVDYLALCEIRCHRYRHLSPKKIYRGGNQSPVRAFVKEDAKLESLSVVT